MAHHIEQDQPADVFRLYKNLRDFVQKEGNLAESGQLDSVISHDDKHAKNVQLLDAVVPAVVVAYAKQDAFQEALRFFLHAGRRISIARLREFLTQIQFDANLRQKAKLYGEKVSTAILLNEPPLLTRHITNRIMMDAVADLDSLYRTIIQGMEGPDAYIAKEVAGITPNKPITMTEISWSAFVVAFIKCRREELAARIWDDMARLGVVPGVATWTSLLDTYDSLRQPENALRAWDMIHEQGLQPDALTYRSLISILLHGRKVEEALHYFGAFQSSVAKKSSPDKLLSVYNTVVNGLLTADQFEKAQTIFHSMRESGPTPDLVTYNTFLTYHSRRQDFKVLASLIEEMGQHKLQGDVFTFSTILSALLRVGRKDAPQIILRLMEKQGVAPNSATYTAIIDHQMREMNETNLKAALRLLDKMEEDPNARPNEVTYTAILSGLHRSHWLDPAITEKYSQEVLKRMRMRNVNLNLPTYHILLKAYMEYPHADGLRKARELYQEMKKVKVTLTYNTWYILLSGLLQRGEWKIANEVIVDMHLSGYQPHGSVLQLVTEVKNRRTPKRSY
ncbi:hypothetical protein BDN72DRAFT_754920 [Pluteus cervinus]|uniref:Uncharacterized protein n=1 Tax=Pluteus cervinus TaxID=181527 RepID=A0ACD3BHZ4_9AGAR|nr:hypothetical protein BDN72DRAFT_754920 [Pluteus cervinus]